MILDFTSQLGPAHRVIHTTRVWITPMDWCCIQADLGQSSDHGENLYYCLYPGGVGERSCPLTIFHKLLDKSNGVRYHHGLGSDPPEGRVLPRSRDEPTDFMVLGRVPVDCPLRSSTPISFTRIPHGCFQMIVCKSIQQTRARFHAGSGSNTPGRLFCYIRSL